MGARARWPVRFFVPVGGRRGGVRRREPPILTAHEAGAMVRPLVGMEFSREERNVAAFAVERA